MKLSLFRIRSSRITKIPDSGSSGEEENVDPRAYLCGSGRLQESCPSFQTKGGCIPQAKAAGYLQRWPHTVRLRACTDDCESKSVNNWRRYEDFRERYHPGSRRRGGRPSGWKKGLLILLIFHLKLHSKSNPSAPPCRPKPRYIEYIPFYMFNVLDMVKNSVIHLVWWLALSLGVTNNGTIWG